MLTTDLVRVIRRDGRLHVPALKPAQRARLLSVADQYTSLVPAHVGLPRRDLDAALDAVAYQPSDVKPVKGLRKLLLDRCSFEADETLDPRSMRAALFVRAATARRQLADNERFDRGAVLAATAAELDLDPSTIETNLFSDLRENHPLATFKPIDAQQLVDTWEMARTQAVLLRATSVTIQLQCPDPAGYRHFFKNLKFRRLLHTIETLGTGGYLIRIDGPFSLFKSVTKYGLQLALMLPVLRQSGSFTLDASVLWDRGEPPLDFHIEGNPLTSTTRARTRLPDDVEKLRKSFAKLDTPWRAASSTKVLDLPGFGVCVPDLVFTHTDTGKRIYLEVMGYWSRDAVWKRVELVQAGLGHPIIFAVSSRLRVSEQVLDADLPGQLLVYKGVIRAQAVAEALDTIAS